MSIELRPSWCLNDEAGPRLVTLGLWVDQLGAPAVGRDGDDWKPGDELRVSRSVTLTTSSLDLRREVGLRTGGRVGIGARWSCQATGFAGVHVGGPEPLDLATTEVLEVSLPVNIAGSVELETCLVVTWPHEDQPLGVTPHRGVVWSDGWTVQRVERKVLLEGGEVRIPVRSVSFKEYFGEPSSALWSISLDPSIEAEDMVSTVTTVLLNTDVIKRDFVDRDGEPDLSRLPPAALAGMSVDLIRALTAALLLDGDPGEILVDLPDGSVGTMLAVRLAETFGSVESALSDYAADQATFSRRLWNRFAPNSWKA